ncbi:uncharacterized protein MONOS_11729 [Monocercomonoides exilis]|uniref:uncharacterized protein n=1 Tax=Monocercomonoides exilis TaxID=2049356 RepID=UPI00355ACA4F|nr:hypothetical protein MONOS_11729 [Monocercomonoides exilis]|eukprot:MONOS_11729.1-p1 / transcript=MONOS_11729.1 / gene=MONOS_11729 / organism=Monocercomonoides_exilis_PA203 / gene_product=unspecified product / transcript_product=unspecified product / location=Mono_scaffold00606:859-3633(+) / protein_length=924 / sequence_SO=supercontig / SO=protein_coding / is_pseudo=false
MDLVEAVESAQKTGSPPYPREGSFIQYINNSKRKGLFIGGGMDYDGNVMKDAYFFDLNKKLWNIVPTYSLDVLPDRYMCISFCAEDVIYIWGGLSCCGLTKELLSYDFERASWEAIPQSGRIPCKRYAPCKAETSTHVYIFGGQGSHGLLNDIWELNKQTFLWRCIRENNASKNPPPLRDGGACVFKGYLFVYGGLTSNIKEEPCTYRINLTNPDDCQFIELISSFRFFGAVFHSGFMSYVSETECYGIMWGGKEGLMKTPINYVFILNLTAAGFDSDVKNATMDDENLIYMNIGKFGPSCTMDEEGTIYAFGGKDKYSTSNRIFHMSKENWLDSQSRNNICSYTAGESVALNFPQNNERNFFSELTKDAIEVPLPVTKHQLARLSGSIAVIGGYNPELKMMMETSRVFKPREGAWYQLIETSHYSDGVPFVGEAAIAESNGRIFVFGGATYNSNGGFASMSNDLFEYNGATQSWQKIKVKGEEKPPKMCRSGATIYESILYIVGGCDIDNNIRDEVWTFNFATSEWHKIMFALSSLQRPTVFVKSIIPRKNLINHKKSKSKYLNNEMDKLKAVKEKEVADSQQSVPHLIVCGGDDGESSIDHCFAYPITIAKIYGEWLDLMKLEFPIGSSRVVIGEGEVGFVVGGEECGIAKKSYLAMFTFDEYGKADIITHKFDEGREETDFPLAHGSCTFLTDSLYCFGGYAVSEGMTPLPIATNKLTRIKLKNHLSGCSPGSFFNESKKQCDYCMEATYSSHLNQTKCEKCPIGSHSWKSGTSIYSCVPCKEGTFMSEINHFYCIDCESNSSCIVGSAADNNTLQRKQFECTEQPKSYDPNSNKETMFTVLFYGVSLALGLIVAVVCFCLPTRERLYKLDQFSNTYKDDLDEKTHKAVKIVRKTSYGGCISIIGFCFVVGAAAAVIVLFF